MKFSEIKNERVFSAISEIIPPICSIAKDKNAMALFRKKVLSEGENIREAAIERISSTVPELLKEHKGEIITILAAIEGVTPAEYTESLNIVKLINDVIELLSDKAFMTLFTSAQAGNAVYGSALESTADAQ